MLRQTLDKNSIIENYRKQDVKIIPIIFKSKDPDVLVLKNYLDGKKVFDGEIKPEQNYGVICGKLSDNLIVIDIEKIHPEDYRNKTLKPRHIPLEEDFLNKIIPECKNTTLTTKTGTENYHVLLKADKIPPKTKKFIFEKDQDNIYQIDFKVTGYCVEAGSIHPNGKPYDLVSNVTEIKRFDLQFILMRLEKIGFAGIETEDEKDFAVFEIDDLLKGGWKRGERRRKQKSLYCKLRRQNESIEHAKEIVRKILDNLDEKLEEDEIEYNFEDAEKFFQDKVLPEHGYVEKQDQTTTALNKAIELLLKYGEKQSKDKLNTWNEQQPKQLSELVLNAIFKTAKKKADKQIKESLEANTEEEEIELNYLRDYCLSKNAYLTIDDKNKNLYIYENGVYRLGGETTIDKILENEFQDQSTIKTRKEVIEKIKIKTLIKREEIEQDDNIINGRNGLFNIETGKISPHTPDHKSLIQWNIYFDKSAKCPKILKFLHDVIVDPRERGRTLQMIASGLWKKDTLTKSYFLIGKGSNGKSVLRNIIIEMVGSENCSNLSFADLSDTFLPAELENKIFNIPDEIDDTQIIQSAQWKTTVAKQSIRAQRKHGQPFDFTPYAKHIMPCNRPPQIDDKSDGTFRRIVPIHFNQRFVKNLTEDEKKKGSKKANDDFTESLKDPGEIAGLFNLLVNVVRGLKKQKMLSSELSIEDVREEWETLADTTKEFIQSELEEDETGKALKTDFYRKYVKFCKNNNYKPLGQNNFYTEFQKHGAVEKRERIEKRGNPQYCFQGFWFKGVRKEVAA